MQPSPVAAKPGFLAAQWAFAGPNSAAGGRSVTLAAPLPPRPRPAATASPFGVARTMGYMQLKVAARVWSNPFVGQGVLTSMTEPPRQRRPIWRLSAAAFPSVAYLEVGGVPEGADHAR